MPWKFVCDLWFHKVLDTTASPIWLNNVLRKYLHIHILYTPLTHTHTIIRKYNPHKHTHARMHTHIHTHKHT